MKLTTFLLLVLPTAALAAGGGPGLAQEDIFVSVLSVDDAAFPEVTAVFTADQRGRPIAELGPADVRIEESGSEATLVSIRRAVDGNIPLALVVALDVSGSMAGATLTNAQASATALINSLGPADSAAVLSFADQVRVEQPLTQDKAALAGAVSRLRALGNTALYDAVAGSARIASDSGLLRRAVVLLSDGEDFGKRSKLDREQSLAGASQGTSLFYVIGVGPTIDRAYLEELAARSGGRFFRAAGASEIPAIYASLEDLLRSQFVVTFRASSVAELQDRSVKISLRQGASVGSAERAYRSLRPPPAPPPPPPVQPAVPETVAPQPSEDSSPPALLIAPVALLAILVGLGAARWMLRTRAAGGPVVGAQTLIPAAYRAPDTASEATVVVTSGPDRGRAFEVGGKPVTIGSGDTCGIRLAAAPGVAAEHARIWWRDGCLMLHHIAPGRVTALAGKSVVWASIEDGDEVAIGPYVLRCLSAQRAVR